MRSRPALVAMILGALLVTAPLFGPLAYTLQYLADFFAERPQSMGGPDPGFYFELLALIASAFGLIVFAIALFIFMRSRRLVTPL